VYILYEIKNYCRFLKSVINGVELSVNYLYAIAYWRHIGFSSILGALSALDALCNNAMLYSIDIDNRTPAFVQKAVIGN